MAWDDEIVTIVRVYLGDISSTPTYSDDDLARAITIAAMVVQREVSFSETYTVSITNQTIRPDPTVGGDRNEDFIWLCSLKTAVLLTSAELRTTGSQAISIKDGTSAIDLRGTLEGTRLTAAQYAEEYEDARWKYSLGERPSGQGIFGPTGVITPMLYGQAGGFQSMSARDRPLFN